MSRVNGRFATLWSALFAAAAFGLAGCSDCDLEVTTTSLPDGFVGIGYAADLDSDCGGDQWFSDGLPPGITMNFEGELRGVPSREGDFAFTVEVIDFNSGEAAFSGLAIRVRRAPPTPTNTPG
jgi:hypothetical protein